jgi:hypothetical protein
MFKGDQLQFTARAYNSDNVEVTENIAWSIEESSVATIDNNGLVMA